MHLAQHVIHISGRNEPAFSDSSTRLLCALMILIHLACLNETIASPQR